MVKFAANLTMMFNEAEFLRRFSLAAASGFKAVEFLFPYPYTADQLKALLEDNRLELVLHNSPAGDWQAGERGIACLPDRTGEFRDGVSQAIEYAKTLGCKRLNSLAGIAPESANRDHLTQVMARTIQTHLGLIDHMQLADNPGRHEPGSGEIHYPFLFRRIDELGYEGWIGCEYKPAADTSAGLTWMKTLASDS